MIKKARHLWSPLFAAIALSLALILPGIIKAATVINLGTADDFAILAGETITNTGSSEISGNLGISPGSALTGFPPGVVSGTQQLANASALQAKTALLAAYNNAAGQLPATRVGTELGGSTLTPGVYDSASGTFAITGTLTLDAEGDPTAVFIFKTASSLVTAGTSQVRLLNGAQACNVYWQVGSSATLGEYSSFQGNILAQTSITVTTGASVEGRLLAQTGSVTLDSNTVTRAICAAIVPEVPPIIPPPVIPVDNTEDTGASATLHIIKHVVNNNGGTLTASDFTVHVRQVGIEVAGSPAAGQETPGSEYTLSPGDYVVSESSHSAYTLSYSGDCDQNGNTSLATDQERTCTLTNTFINPGSAQPTTSATTSPSATSPRLPNAGLPPLADETL